MPTVQLLSSSWGYCQGCHLDYFHGVFLFLLFSLCIFYPLACLLQDSKAKPVVSFRPKQQ